jgi:hypothetical protein
MFVQLPFKLVHLFKTEIANNETDEAMLQIQLIFASNKYDTLFTENGETTITLHDVHAVSASNERFYSIIAAF